MSIIITINNIDTLSDTERAVLRLIAGNEVSVSATLEATVRNMAHDHNEGCTLQESLDAGLKHFGEYGVFERAMPIEPIEVHSPHTLVIDPPAPPAPAAPAAPAPAMTFTPISELTNLGPFASVELDVNGLPWDKRIHASTRTKVAAGTWKYARGVDGDYIKTVERELRAVQDIPVPAAATPPFTPVTPSLEAQEAATYDQDSAPAASALIVPLPPVPAAPAPIAVPMTFAQLMQHISPMLVSGKLTQSMLQDVVGACGLPHLAALGARPDLVETVRAAIDAEVCK